MKNEFHIHVDAIRLSDGLRDKLISGFGFYESDFAGHPEGVEGFEPPHHLTKKMDSGQEFRQAFALVREAVVQPGAMTGYLEGEYLPIDEDLPEKPFDASIPLPVSSLSLGAVAHGEFRESEIHIVMDADRSDPRLIENLTRMGFFSAYMNKPYGKAVIFTAGGFRRDIVPLLKAFQAYLLEAGGSIHGSIKEERIVDYWLSDTSLRLPPIVSEIEWNASKV